jgi:hypothetical protein
LSERSTRLRKTCIDIRIGRHVDFAKDAAERAGERFALLGIEIEDRNLDAERRERACRRGTEPGRP